MTTKRTSMAAPPNTNLYCAQCDSQIGIFENEWRRLTTSYIYPKEIGTCFGTTIGDKTQTVPLGEVQKVAAGCEMAEAFCQQCSIMVAQFCKAAPDTSKRPLVGKYFYKLSRVYMKDAQTSEKVEPIIVDNEQSQIQERSASVRSSHGPRPRVPSFSDTPQNAFRQSFPPASKYPPLSSQENSSAELPPRDIFQQPPMQHPFSTPAMHYSSYSQFHQPFAQLPPADHFRPASANGISSHSRDFSDLQSTVNDSLDRISAMEARISSEATRTSSVEVRSTGNEEKFQKLDTSVTEIRKQAQKIDRACSERASDCVKHATTIKAQQTEIAEQTQQLKAVMSKMEALQANMNELREILTENRSRSLVVTSARPHTSDFLKNLEVMVRAMRDTRANDQEVQTLRDENKKMKARLKSIATVMGTASNSEREGSEEEHEVEDLEDIQTLGKRKRNDNPDDKHPRKVSRQVHVSLTNIKASATSLPTPDASQHEAQSPIVSQQQENEVIEFNETREEDASQSAEPQPQSEDEVVMIDDSSDVEETMQSVPDPEPEAKDILEEPVKQAEKDSCSTSNLVDEPSGETKPQDSSNRVGTDIETAPVQQPEKVQETPATTDLQTEDNDIIPRSQAQVPPTAQGSSLVHAGQWYQPYQYSRPTQSQILNRPGPFPPYYPSNMFPPSHFLRTPYTPVQSTHPVQRQNNSNGKDTYSRALSRGERLEHVVQRAARSPSVFNSATPQPSVPPLVRNSSNGCYAARNTNTQQRQNTTLQGSRAQTQSNSTSVPQLKDRSDAVRNAANGARYGFDPSKNAGSINFSDEENHIPVGMSQTSQSRAAEPNRRLTDSMLVSRTVPGFTLEPLKRPVVQESASTPGTSRAPSVIPEFMHAIQNLNGSAARHAASPNLTHAMLHPPVQDMQRSKGLVGAHKKSRKSEPIMKVSVEVARTSVSQAKLSSATTVPAAKTATFKVVPPQSKENQKPPQADTLSTSPKSNPPGRPRKDCRPSSGQSEPKASVSAKSQALIENDDECAVCDRGGKLTCCDGCPKAYHLRCLDSDMKAKAQGDGDWFCPKCIEKKNQQKADKENALKNHLREQVLLERNRLAQETIAREAAAVKGR